MSWTVDALPDLQPLTQMDAYLRQVATDPGTVRQAIAAAARALKDAREAGDKRAELSLLGYLTEACRIIGDIETAERHGRAALELAENGTARQRIVSRLRLGEVWRCAGRYTEAAQILRTALTDIVDTDTEMYRDFVLQHLGKTYLNANLRDDAIMALREALRIRQRKGDAALIASSEEALRFAVSGKGVCRPGL